MDKEAHWQETLLYEEPASVRIVDTYPDEYDEFYVTAYPPGTDVDDTVATDEGTYFQVGERTWAAPEAVDSFHISHDYNVTTAIVDGEYHMVGVKVVKEFVKDQIEARRQAEYEQMLEAAAA